MFLNSCVPQNRSEARRLDHAGDGGAGLEYDEHEEGYDAAEDQGKELQGIHEYESERII